MATIRRLVFDVLKPHEPTTLALAERVANVEGVGGVNASVVEIDQEVENLKLTIEGDEIDSDGVTEAIEDAGASVHSVDQVVCGERLVEETHTPQE